MPTGNPSRATETDVSILNESRASVLASFSVHHDDGSMTAPRDGLSIVAGEHSPPLRHVTVPDMLADIVMRHGARDAIVLSRERHCLTYAEFARRVDRLAAGLLALGLGKGDRVGIWSPNRLEWVLTQFATARIGAILVNINPAYRRAEVEYALNRVACKALVTAERFKSSDYLGTMRTLAPEIARCEPGRLVSAALPHLRVVIAMSEDPGPGIVRFADIVDRAEASGLLQLDRLTRSLDPSDPINIQFTSGTTGAPKGATLTHSNIVNNARFVTDRIRFSEHDRLCIPVPLYHCFGMVMGVLGCVVQGAAMVFPGEGFDAVETLEAVSRERCTAVYGVPTMFIAMLDELARGAYDLSAMRTGIMAGASCPIEIMRRVIDEMNMPDITICYGMTETSPVSFQSHVFDPLEKRVATVGCIHPHVEAKIVDEAGDTVAVGHRGELLTRGYSVMTGYWNDEARTREAIVDGWMHTGDLATLDNEGFCAIVGRVKDMIIRGGENIYPREIEEFLHRHPSISQAQVFGIPDTRYGEQVCAWVIPERDTDLQGADVIDFCTGEIAHFKVPRHVRIVDALPMTVTGKPQKFVMRDWMIEHGYVDAD